MLTPLAWLLGLLLPACGATGAQGVPATAPDFAHLVRPSSPNTALAAPAGYTSAARYRHAGLSGAAATAVRGGAAGRRWTAGDLQAGRGSGDAAGGMGCAQRGAELSRYHLGRSAAGGRRLQRIAAVFTQCVRIQRFRREPAPGGRLAGGRGRGGEASGRQVVPTGGMGSGRSPRPGKRRPATAAVPAGRRRGWPPAGMSRSP